MFHLKSNSIKKTIFFMPLIISLIIVAISINSTFSHKKVNYEEAALGENNIADYAKVGKYSIHCSDISRSDNCIKSFYAMGGKRATIWLGNSQVHAINQFESGQRTMSSLLYSLLKEKNKNLITFSQPNANLQEHYLLYQYLKSHIPIEALILPVVFDDMRETGLREGIRVALDDPLTRVQLDKTSFGQKIIRDNTVVSMDGSEERRSIQEDSELMLTNWLEKNSDFWGSREQLRGELFYKLYYLRNEVFGIKASSKRKMIKGNFEENVRSLENLLADAQRSDIKVFMYITPIRSDVSLPYNMSEYREFKHKIEVLANTYKINFVNLESVVPAQYWGYKVSTNFDQELELDFMHFQAKGHEILASKLFEFLSSKNSR